MLQLTLPHGPDLELMQMDTATQGRFRVIRATKWLAKHHETLPGEASRESLDGEEEHSQTAGEDTPVGSLEIAQGLLNELHRTLPFWYLYDKEGSELFEKITALPEYYLTRAERSILVAHADEIVAAVTSSSSIPTSVVMIELGSGSSSKTRILLGAFLQSPRITSLLYVPIDISSEILHDSSLALMNEFSRFDSKFSVIAICGTYQQGLALVRSHRAFQSATSSSQRLFTWLGSSIGNLDRNDAAEFLRTHLRTAFRPTDRLLIGIDLWVPDVKPPAMLAAAYDDAAGITDSFNRNLLTRLNREFGGNFELAKFRHCARVVAPGERAADGRIAAIGRVEMHLECIAADAVVRVDKLNVTLQFSRGDSIHTENSHKYTLQQIDELAIDGGFRVDARWLDTPHGWFSLNLLSPNADTERPLIGIERREELERVLAVIDNDDKPLAVSLWRQLHEAWALSDFLFGMLDESTGAFSKQPIALRHPFLFYLGHLPAFAQNQVVRHVLGSGGLVTVDIASPLDAFDEIFERGIDPNVDDPRKCHPHSPVPRQWPTVGAIRQYRDGVRGNIRRALPRILRKGRARVAQAKDTSEGNFEIGSDGAYLEMSVQGRVVLEVVEHELMHVETLLYMFMHLQRKFKTAREVLGIAAAVLGKSPLQYAAYDEPLDDPPRAQWLQIPAGITTLGALVNEVDFAWDNEFPRNEVFVEAFEISSLPVTNGEFLEFVMAGGYTTPSYWTAVDWQWKEQRGLCCPIFWEISPEKQCAAAFSLKMIMGERVPLEKVRSWPVFVSLAEANAYACWKGCRIPTEAEYHRAVYGRRDRDGDNAYPWGDAAPVPGVHGNFGFIVWSPCRVDAHPAGASEFGVLDAVGNGWEWTSTVFWPLDRFRPLIRGYPGYSADFFDGVHYVLKGASWATHERLVRRSFRNWYQARYPEVFAKFRLVRVHHSQQRTRVH